MIYYSNHNMWPEILTLARQIPLNAYNFYDAYDVNRALYHMGRLGEEMFSYPQNPDAPLLFMRATEPDMLRCIKGIDVLIEIGDLNLAEKLAYEVFENWGTSPFVLRRLALINLVKGQTQTARVFLNILSKDLIYGKGAKKDLRWLDSNPELTGNAEVRRLRSIMWLENYAVSGYTEEFLLQQLLERNPHNKMAFEYQMAHYLLTRQLDRFVENTKRLDDFGYSRIPAHYQEAIVIYMNKTGKVVNVPGQRINQEMFQQYAAFSISRAGIAYKNPGNDRQKAWNSLVRQFGSSYFFYFFFGPSGATK